MIGVFGGTFDPPHIGHLVLADEAAAVLGLEKVLWLVAGQAPHKLDWKLSSVDDRVAMVEAAIADENAFELSRIDIERPGPHYTIDSLRIMKKTERDNSLALILGSDSLLEIDTWRDPDKILELVDRIPVLRRPNTDISLSALEQDLPGVVEKVVWLQAPNVGVSGRDIRSRARDGRPFRFMVPSAVFDLIRERKLYL